jgi:hypothetical protein
MVAWLKMPQLPEISQPARRLARHISTMRQDAGREQGPTDRLAQGPWSLGER